MTAELKLPKPFRGIVPPMVTPLLNDDTLDEIGLERLINHMISGGVHGLFVLGTTGEGTSLSYRVRRELIDLTCKMVGGRIPVMAGITDAAPEESISLAKTAAKAGVQAVVAAPPYYFSMSQDELFNYYWSLADRLPLPLYLYNMPSHTKVNIAPETVKKLSAHPGIIGLKDSSANAVYLNVVCSLLKEEKAFALLVGPEEMMASAVLMGVHGGVNGGANMFPRLYVDLYDAVVAKDFELIFKLQEIVMEVSNKLYGVGDSPSSYLQGLKTALAQLGICNDHIAYPLSGFSKEQKEIIKKNLRGLLSITKAYRVENVQ